MRIVLLNHSPYGNSADARSNTFLAACARWLSVPLRVLEIRRLRLWSGIGQLEVAPDEVVVPRVDIRDSRDLWLAQSALRSFEQNGARIAIGPDALAMTEDKLRFGQVLQRAGISSLPTVAIRAAVTPPSDLDQIVQRLGGLPLCVKLPFGSGGMGVMPCRDLATLRSVLTYSHVLVPSELLLVQPLIAHDSTVTVRMVQGRVIHAYRCYVGTGETRANPRFGGRVEEVRDARLLDDLAALCGRTLAIAGLTAGAVDVLEARDGRRLVLGASAAPAVSTGDSGDRRFAEAFVRHVVGGAAHPPSVRLVTPFGLDEPRGNSVATARIATSLRDEGIDVAWEVAGEPGSRIEARTSLASGLLHAMHAVRSGPHAARIAAQNGWPLVVSFRGTDLESVERAGAGFTAAMTAARAARVVTVLSEEQRERLVRAVPEVADRVRVVPQGVRLPKVPFDRAATRVRHGVAVGERLVVQVAGLRREKGFPACLRVLENARAGAPGLVYRLAGPVLDPELTPLVESWFADKPWARFLGPLRHDESLALTAAADVTLHASESEGQSNALLEALALGVPVVARDGAATRSVVTDERDGLLYADVDGGARCVVKLLNDRALAQRLADQGRRTIAERFSAEAELEGYLAAYRAAVGES